MEAQRSVWFDGAAPALEADDLASVTARTWDVVVIGGGIVGLLAALRLRRSGREVCLLEARRIGEGTTGHATVKVTSGHGRVNADLARRHGMEVATAYQRANGTGYSELADLVATLPEDVGWVPSPHVVHASTSTEQLHTSALIATNTHARVSQCAPPPWSRGQAWAWFDSALVQPLSLARALGRALQREGVPVVEGARAIRVNEGAAYPRVQLAGGGEARGRDVVVATHTPTHDPDGHALRAGFLRHAAVAVPVLGSDVPSSYDLDGYSTRPVTLPDGRPGAVVVGSSHRTGSIRPEHWQELEDWALAALHAGPATHRWGAQDVRTFDALPYVGRTNRAAHVLVATGFNAWGFTNAAVAATLLERALDDQSPGLEEWDAARLVPEGGLTTAAHDAGWVTASLIGDHARSLVGAGDLAPGQGQVVGGPVNPRAECVTSDGRRHCVSARCTHVGCLVRWNAAEESWDCPCHGSRFAPDGSVLEGPADTPLKPSP